jgi:hypothetical protein
MSIGRYRLFKCHQDLSVLRISETYRGICDPVTLTEIACKAVDFIER